MITNRKMLGEAWVLSMYVFYVCIFCIVVLQTFVMQALMPSSDKAAASRHISWACNSCLLDTHYFFPVEFSLALDPYNGSLENPFRCVCVHWKGCSVTCFGLLMSEFMILCPFPSSLFPVRDCDWRWQLAGLHRSHVC